MYFFSNPYYEGERDEEKEIESTNNLLGALKIVDYVVGGFTNRKG